ncbi:nrdD anaerobic ribonucleoside-triphosphate reductase [Candidatus Phycorickettsia trachydisci]|uniref:NrdD anaerobic ribonucleoside-triphosphate reductase n=1 Tax=Candidatus Phycorickettsia trachydisci TaxID=2115978 RepID=A0A2P1P961_9RICK|nr:ribonucleoside triphosphate reductase [Candidatus Phycorickettsia trachydisci]AVP87797.1 nrdD anaerobic ribonucleoside-triphosphate reductase [Candidatus Phycorickettsia trachydisci]
MDTILKRDGQIVSFDPNKITSAIEKAALATKEFDTKVAKDLTAKVLELTEKLIDQKHVKAPSIEEVQDMVEKVLLSSEYKKTAKAYVIYREEHAKIREFLKHANTDMVDEYLDKLDWQVNENSNMSYSIQGLNNYISSKISKNYWLNRIYPYYIRDAHSDGDIHIHDLNVLSVYCVGWDLKDLLLEGFKGVQGKVESGPAKHFRTALGQIVNFLYTLQGEAAGAQAFSNFDTLLAPFIRYDNLDYDQVKQAMQEFLFNLNVPTRTGFQTPFTNITMDLTVPSYYADHNVIIGGQFMSETYKDFQHEMNLVNKAFFEIMMEGDRSGRVFTFPIPTYNITKDFDWDNRDLDGLWEMTAKYGIPYFSNFINSDMNPEDARSMCCRLRIDNRELDYRGGGLFGSNPLTGSIGVVTINLPRIGFTAKNKEEFFKILEEKMILAKISLELKRKVLEQFTDKNLYPYAKFYLRDIKKRYGVYWKNHFSTIGLIGMNEACLNLIDTDIASEKGKSFALEVMNFMRNKMIEFQQETGHNYNLEATPAEGTSYRLAKIDKASLVSIKCANDCNTTYPFYTNSTQLPVNHTDDIFEVLDHQDDIQTKYTGGTVVHIFAGERIHDAQNIKNLVKKICINYHLPYFTFTPTFSTCPNHGYLKGEHPTCPECGSECEVYSRVVGYIRPIKQWNDGKKAEFKKRKTYTVEKSYADRRTA